MSEPALVLEDLHHTFFPGTPNEQRALEGVDLVMEERDFVMVVGSNGSGKSTLLNAVAGTLMPDRGRVRIGGEDVTGWPEWRRAALVGRVFQNPVSGTIGHLTIAENLAVAAKRGMRHGVLRNALGRGRRRALAERVRELGLGLEDRLDTPVGALSGGQRQALTLLMATWVRPRLLLLDEHTSALDPGSTEQMVRLTDRLIRSQGLTTLMVTHSIQQAVALGDRVLIMHRGRVVESIGGARKRRLRVEELLDSFDRLRSADLVDESAAEMVRRLYI
ncbi:MAG TPA: ATP-binding cassette domain-containing protein [Gemmatimonadales bacterium]|nr:ATP-binding cassette domain-containing protein [Gemmatimonadales bacterium]